MPLVRTRRMLHRRVVFPFLDLVLPTACFGCGRPLGPVQSLGACPECWAALRPLPGPRCPGCAIRVAGATDLLGPAGGRCSRCVLDPLPFAAARAALPYDRLARKFLLRAKLGGQRELLPPLGRLLARTLVSGAFARGCTVVVPVPAHPWITLRRGFNPALEVARPVAAALSLPLRHGELVRRAAPRVRPLKRLTRWGRREAVSRAFLARPSVRGERILLVDDVLTTGATAAACARALRRAGSGEVRLAVCARVDRRGPPRFDGARRTGL